MPIFSRSGIALGALMLFSVAPGAVLADMLGRTDDGRQVILRDDGTWAFITTIGPGAGPPPAPPPATQPATPPAIPTTPPPAAATSTLTTGPGWKVLAWERTGPNWTQPDFDDSAWQDATAPWPYPPAPAQGINGMENTSAQWIWHPDGIADAAFRLDFDLDRQPDAAWLRITADNSYTLYVNGSFIGEDTANDAAVWQNAETYSVAPFLVPGRNVIAVIGQDYGVAQGLLADLTLTGAMATAATGPTPTSTGGSTIGNSTIGNSNTGSSTGIPPAIITRPVVVDVGLEDVDVYQYSYRNWDNANWAKWGSLALSSNVDGIPNTNRRIYFRLDPAPLAAAVASGARVLLQLTSAETSTGSGDIELFRVVTPWNPGNGTYHSGQDEPDATPGEITWNAQPVIDFSRSWARVSMSPGTHTLPFDITDLVKAWLAGDFPNYGVVLVGANEGSASYHYVFSSTESPQSGPPVVLLVPG